MLYLGVGPVMRVPQQKAVGYTVVLVLCVILLGAIVGGVVATIFATLAVTAAVGLHSLTH